MASWAWRQFDVLAIIKTVAAPKGSARQKWVRVEHLRRWEILLLWPRGRNAFRHETGVLGRTRFADAVQSGSSVGSVLNTSCGVPTKSSFAANLSGVAGRPATFSRSLARQMPSQRTERT